MEQAELDDCRISLTQYLGSICSAFLGRSLEDIFLFLQSSSSQEILSEFCCSANSSVLFLGNFGDDSQDWFLLPSIEDIASLKYNCVSILKVVEKLHLGTRFNSQLQVITLSNPGNGSDSLGSISSLYRFTSKLYEPLLQIEEKLDETKKDSMNNIQKRLRDLDSCIEQYLGGASIPRVIIKTFGNLESISSRLDPLLLRGLLEKFNPTQVDSFLQDIGLSSVFSSPSDTFESFANSLGGYARLWPQEVSKQTRLVAGSFQGSIENEIEFWKEINSSLESTRNQFQTPSILLTKLILRRLNRVSEQLIRETELDIEKALDLSQNSLSFIRDFPVERISSCNDIVDVKSAVEVTFHHFNRLKYSKYDFNRALKLIDLTAVAFATKIVDVLQKNDVFLCSVDKMKSLRSQIDDFNICWNNEVTLLKSSLKDLAKRRNEVFSAPVFSIDVIIRRFFILCEFREQHEKILSIFQSVLSGQDDKAVFDLQEAYQMFVSSIIDYFNASTDDSIWIRSKRVYDMKLDAVEGRVKELLEIRLKSAQSTEEMFRIFSLFNPLFYRPSIRSAVNSYQSDLMKSVKIDVKRLQEKFLCRYDDSSERIAAEIHDVPPLSGRILWAKQIEHQLSTVLTRLESVLGNGWEFDNEGKQLKEVCDELRSKLDTNQLYSEWLTNLLKPDLKRTTFSKDFLIAIEEDPRTGHRRFRVNFDEKQLIIFKEVRYLEWLLPSMSTMHKVIPRTIIQQSQEAYIRYPIAMSLEAAMSSYYQAQVGINKFNANLLASHVAAVRELLSEAFGASKKSKKWIKWDSADILDWSNTLSIKIASLQEKVEDLNIKLKEVEFLLSELTTCSYEKDTFARILHGIQMHVDEMQTRGFSNVSYWVIQLDERLERILLDRVMAEIKIWVTEFSNNFNINEVEPKIISKPTIHELSLSNQVLFVDPPLEASRSFWIRMYNDHLQIATSLHRLSTSKFNVFSAVDSESRDFTSILSKIDKNILLSPYRAIERGIQQATVCVEKWIQYQSLWDASASIVSDLLGRDIKKWQQLLVEIKDARKSIDSSDEESFFGPIVVSYGQIQNKVSLKYDSWQKECQTRFGMILSEEIKVTNTDICNLRERVEKVNLDGSTKDVVVGVETILSVKSCVSQLGEFVSSLEDSQKLLQKQRFQFPKDFEFVSNITSKYSDLVVVLDRRTKTMESQLPLLQSRIRDEEVHLKSKVEQLLRSWEQEKPLAGHLLHSDVLITLNRFSLEASKLQEDITRIKSAKQALGLEHYADERMMFVIQEMADLKDVWTAVVPLHEKLGSMRSMLFKSVDPLKVRKLLEELIDELRNFPVKLRSYPAVEWLQERISKFQSFQGILRDLTSDALKDRHWRQLLKILKVPCLMVDMTVGNFWDSNPSFHKKAISDIMSVAQGELAIEIFLRDLKDGWSTMDLQLVSRDGFRVIAGWDSLFTQLEDNINSLASLKQSPYFKNVGDFQEDTTLWENKLTLLRGILDIWVEVQKKWIYLRCIFNNADIKAQLPSQSTKFRSIDSEINSLIKRVSSKPLAIELLQIENLHRQLERHDSSMSIIQKALGEYLERQRQSFPRFYFVNNDDLVEILGNSNEVGKIFNHLSKMFASIASFQVVKGHIISFSSREGETITLPSQIDTSIAIREWLSLLDQYSRESLQDLLEKCIVSTISSSSPLKNVSEFPAQVSILANEIEWCNLCEKGFRSPSGVVSVSKHLENKLLLLSESVLGNLENLLRKKVEQLLTELVHQRDVTRSLQQFSSVDDFGWRQCLRYYWNVKASNSQKLSIMMANASFFYGFEYLGVSERLVQTPLTDRCYLTLTQALHYGLGGNPFGPAGTGKTESVKMLGSNLGRFVLVFNCDASFDYAAMGRIFSGLCQVGAWGCFDEFNRLEERILSAVSQQILSIQRGLLHQASSVELLGQSCKLHRDVGIFITMNPGYAGRSNLPDNLKQLFRAVAMVTPDRKLICQVMLFSQGIVSAEDLAGKIVLLFVLCEEQLSPQSHYDFGLRALKSVLLSAGEMKRKVSRDSIDQSISIADIERDVMIRSICDSVLPKLVAEDIPIFKSLVQSLLPNANTSNYSANDLSNAVKLICEEDLFFANEKWVEKIIQLNQVVSMRHGVILMGKTCCGKTSAWKTLIKALSKLEKTKSDFFVIEPKTISKEKLFGSLDPNTLEWTDGIFTRILRRVCESSQQASTARRTWIVFDGDVDPEWAENLNSVLDDNKVLTLPSGDRLKLPDNVRILMEIDSLKYATLATISRCGMLWFPDDTLSIDLILKRKLLLLKQEYNYVVSKTPIVGRYFELLSPMFEPLCLVPLSVEFTMTLSHIMTPLVGRISSSFYAFLQRGAALLIDHIDSNPDLCMDEEFIRLFANRWLLFSLLWGLGGSLSNDGRNQLAQFLERNSNVEIPSGRTLLEQFPNISDNSWLEWSSIVPKMDIESHKVVSSDVVITTADTLRHVEILKSWLSSHQPIILCGPPGSGKTMTLMSVLEALPECILAPLNFSSGTTPDLITKTFAQFCETVDSPEGLILQPSRQLYRENQWLVIFCDEINLPMADKYGTQNVIMFIRQLTDQKGFWNSSGRWVQLKRIQFVGACNPPSDAGRIELCERFLRHVSLLFVDYPVESSLRQIYKCFNSALMKLHPNLKGFVDPMTNAMVEVFLLNQQKFTSDIAPQYIYSPREMSRWVRALYEAMEPVEMMIPEEFLRLWAHEALRLFHDRLISESEKIWCNEIIDSVSRKHFGGIDTHVALQRPLLFSKWIKKNYTSTEKDVLRHFVSARLKVFYEEELDVPIVIFDDVLEHILRIDNVLRHPMGHLLLVGESGVGKTVLTRFVAWINGLSIFQIKASNKFTLEQFDEDLKTLFRRVGVNGEKICFIFDESNVLSSAFLEKMNALLASGEIPGLFEGEERSQLLASCRESFSQRDGLLFDSDDELWRRFVKVIQRNLHVVFTMNPVSSDFDNRCVTSPALFNRCVVDWFGTWSLRALCQVAYEFTLPLDTGYSKFDALSSSLLKDSLLKDSLLQTILDVTSIEIPTLRECIVASIVNIHEAVKSIVQKLNKNSSKQHFISPRDFLDFIKQFIAVENEKRSHLEEQQTHTRLGLQKLMETQESVNELRSQMVKKESVLRAKDLEANAKLNQMVEKQNEAEVRKGVAEELTKALKTQNDEINSRLSIVEKELSEAEPALIAAKQAVQNIKKAHLDEVRALVRPPNAVQLTMEMVCIMLGEKNTDWNEIRKFIRRDDFLTMVLNFDSATLTAKQIKLIQEDYLRSPDLDYSSVDRASKACGQLYPWVVSQIKYSIIVRQIKPLRDEVTTLQIQSQELEIKQKAAVAEVDKLETAIARYKAEYAAAIRDTETIRTEMESVKKKVNRAESLLRSLEREKDRWQSSMESFDFHMSTLIGDSLLSGAFLAYCGSFDHKVRRVFLEQWFDILDKFHIPRRNDLDVALFLSKPSDLLSWKSHGLPSDELALQNAILLERFNRYPLIIDPSGQATSFIMKKFSDRRIVQASFLDSSFLKTLASCIRFGTPLLVHDVESVDPILNPLLNKEFQKTGGRTLVRLGSEDVDFSPKFLIFLSTRNPLANFSPDLCSRVTIVNFTVTPASLEAQSLSLILRSERPDVDRKRSEILRLQGEQSVKMRELEESLLDKISAVQGAILDDDIVVNALETIKRETVDLNNEVLRTDEVFLEVKQMSAVYEKIAVNLATCFFALEKFGDLESLYQFSLEFFLTIVDGVLQRFSKDCNASGNSRLQMLSWAFLDSLCRRVLPSLRNDDKIVFMAELALIFTSEDSLKSITDVELNFILRGPSLDSMNISSSNVSKFRNLISGVVLDEIQAKSLFAISLLPNFQFLLSAFSHNDFQELWKRLLNNAKFEESLAMNIFSMCSFTPEKVALLTLVVIRALRPDHVLLALEYFINSVFTNHVPWRDYCKPDVVSLVEKDSRCNIPIMLCSDLGHDASGRLEALASEFNQELLQVAMGSAEGFIDAEKAINQGAKIGSWVLLRNVHLCTEWLQALEKKLFSLRPHERFRLFLTCEIHPGLPTSIIRLSDVLIYEASDGLKANIQRFIGSIPRGRIEKAPAERCRLYTLLAWFNAVVQERLRYAPLGWSKKYEFSESDAWCALNVIDEWLESVAMNRNHINPMDLPWQAIKVTLCQSVYGGRIDVPGDQSILDGFVNSIFCPEKYNSRATIAMDLETSLPLVYLPEGLNYDSLDRWIRELPDENPPTWLGLPNVADVQLAIRRGFDCLSRLRTVQVSTSIFDNAVGLVSSNNHGNESMMKILNQCEVWLSALPPPDYFPKAFEISDAILNQELVLARCLSREILRGVEILSVVREELESVKLVCQGKSKATNRSREMLQAIKKDCLPTFWKSFALSPQSLKISLEFWINNFLSRLASFAPYLVVCQSKVSDSSLRRKSLSAEVRRVSLLSINFTLGALYYPEAFITATRQLSAQASACSIDELEMYLEPSNGAPNSNGETSFVVKSISIEGAELDASHRFVLSSKLSQRLDEWKLVWRLKRHSNSRLPYLVLPIFLDSTRTKIVAYSKIPIGGQSNLAVEDEIWKQRGVALCLSG